MAMKKDQWPIECRLFPSRRRNIKWSILFEIWIKNAFRIKRERELWNKCLIKFISACKIEIYFKKNRFWKRIMILTILKEEI